MELKHVTARFYVSATGTNPVREWLMRLPLPDRRQLGHDIRDVEFCWPVGMPGGRVMGDPLDLAEPPHCAGAVLCQEW